MVGYWVPHTTLFSSERFSRYRRSWTFDLCLSPWLHHLSSCLLFSSSLPGPRHSHPPSDPPRHCCHCRPSWFLSSPEWYKQGWLSSSSPSEVPGLELGLGLGLELGQGRGPFGWYWWQCWRSHYLCVPRKAPLPLWLGGMRPVVVVGEECCNCWETQGELA